MAREIAISIYLFTFQLLFNIFKLFPQKRKTVCVASFGDNVFYTAKSLNKISNEDIIILKEPSCRYKFDPSVSRVISFDIKQPFSYLKGIYHLATASTILVDNYFGFLAAIKFRQDTTCIQVWHAAGAIKQFGLLDPTNAMRTEKARERFQNVYNNFHYVTVGSEEMAATFQKSFGLANHRFLRTGIPRSDVLFDDDVKEQIYNEMIRKHPNIQDKKVILYAPTFRNEELSNYQLELNIDYLYQELSDEYVLFIKPHPAVTYSFEKEYENFVYDVSNYYDTNSLLLVTDLLITDYSSIPFEYALLGKPMIFFAYDMEEYKIKSGLMDNYETEMPGPILFSTEAIVQKIKEHDFDKNKINIFANKWNEYSNGNSSINLARFIIGAEEVSREKVPI